MKYNFKGHQVQRYLDLMGVHSEGKETIPYTMQQGLIMFLRIPHKGTTRQNSCHCYAQYSSDKSFYVHSWKKTVLNNRLASYTVKKDNIETSSLAQINSIPRGAWWPVPLSCALESTQDMGHEQSERLVFPHKTCTKIQTIYNIYPHNWILRLAANSNLMLLASKIFNMDLKFKIFTFHVDFLNTELTPVLE